jgi:hypothetical protein
MSKINQLPARLPRHLRPRREKVFGEARGIPLDGNAKARIMAYAKAWNVKHRQPRQHKGPITRAFMDVLETLLWGFHNSRDGRCFPSYESIAERAGCNRRTVYEAIIVLERAELLSWVNRLTRIRDRVPDLFGKWSMIWRTIRTSNSYSFRDPLPCSARVPGSKLENPSGTLIQESSFTNPPLKVVVLNPENPLDLALIRLGRSVGALPAGKLPQSG